MDVTNNLLPKIATYCQTIESEFRKIPETRKEKLKTLSHYIQNKLTQQKTARIIVICTHNSRRSHLGQLWLAIGADYYGFSNLQTYSGGTEATAFNVRAVAALKRVGLEIDAQPNGENPLYQVRWQTSMPPYQAFSKKYDAPPNPTKDFAAIMVCSSADKDCPIVLGADFRLALPFDDPKAFDDTSIEAEKYSERCRDIAREMLFVLSGLKI